MNRKIQTGKISPPPLLSLVVLRWWWPPVDTVDECVTKSRPYTESGFQTNQKRSGVKNVEKTENFFQKPHTTTTAHHIQKKSAVGV